MAAYCVLGLMMLDVPVTRTLVCTRKPPRVSETTRRRTPRGEWRAEVSVEGSSEQPGEQSRPPRLGLTGPRQVHVVVAPALPAPRRLGSVLAADDNVVDVVVTTPGRTGHRTDTLGKMCPVLG